MDNIPLIFICGIIVGSILQYHFDLLGKITHLFLRAGYAKKRYYEIYR